MGYIRHNVIVCTFWDMKRAELCHSKAKEIFGKYVTEITPESTNGYCAFMIPPDGSKEGWAESVDGDCRRERFRKWLDENYSENYCKWFEAVMPEDDKTYILGEQNDTE